LRSNTFHTDISLTPSACLKQKPYTMNSLEPFDAGSQYEGMSAVLFQKLGKVLGHFRRSRTTSLGMRHYRELTNERQEFNTSF
jgi:hypothetical protein